MDISPEMITIGAELTTIAGKSIEAVFDRIKVAKQTENKEETIGKLESIINDLISDKNSLIRIAHSYEEKLVDQKITENEIKYITESILPLIEKLLDQSDSDGAEKTQDSLDMIKSVISKETLSILQILGFNFKEAIGEPLTKLLASLIESKIINTDGMAKQNLLSQQKEIELMKICQDEAAFSRLQSIYKFYGGTI